MAASNQVLESKQTPKYIVQNGRLQPNPDYKADKGSCDPSAPPAYSDVMSQQQLTMVTSLQDLMQVSDATQLGVPQQLQDTLQTIQSQEYVKAFDAKGIDGGVLIDGLGSMFGRYEIPIGLMSKLTVFKGASLHFKIDDSGSMNDPSNLLIADLSPHMRKVVVAQDRKNTTRWEEAQDRLHILIDVLAYVPTGPIIFSFFDRYNNTGKRVVLDRTGKSPEQFLAEAHQAIYLLFQKQPGGGTPIHSNLTNMLNEANQKRGNSDLRTFHYLLSDGEPDGQAQEIRLIKDLLSSQSRYAKLNPVTFLGCSNDRRDYAWMHEMEEIAPFVAALPDFRDEQIEVRNDQGNVFPYSRGMWLLCNIAAAINPDDLDAMDQHPPFTKKTLENLMGRGMTESEYSQYFNSHPNARRVFAPDYLLFLQSQYASDIPSVRLFQNVLRQNLSRDVDNAEDDSEDRDERIAEQAVLDSRQRYAGTLFSATPDLRQSLLPQAAPAKDDCCPCVIL